MDNREALIREMMVRADLRLVSQQQIALAADARSMQFVGVCIAGGSLTIAIGGSDASAFHFVVAGLLLVAATLAFWAAKPIEWHPPGMLPSSFDEDIDADKNYLEVMLELSKHLEFSITENKRILHENSRHFLMAFLVAVMSPVIGVLAMFS